jgi:signal transduction histidine kinase
VLSTTGRLSAAVVAAVAVAVVTREVAALQLDARAVAVVAASMATALMAALTLVSFLSWRLATDRRSLYISAACCCYVAVPLLLGVVLPSVSQSDLSGTGGASQLAAVPAVAVYGLAARRATDRAGRRAWSVAAPLLVTTGAIAAVMLVLPDADVVDLEPGTPAGPGTRLGLAVLAVAWAGLAVVHAAASRRRATQVAWGWSVTAAGISVAYGAGAAAGPWTEAVGWMVMDAALLAGLLGATTELQRHHAAERRDLRDALVRAAVATSRAQAVDQGRAELRHDARAALLGIEAAARGLSVQRDLLTPQQWNELSAGLVAEVHRLGALLDERATDGDPFDLRDAIMPVVACARAEGLDVAVDVAAGIEVEGSREGTGRVLLSLLDNARVHAPGSGIRVRVVAGPDEVALRVEDRGPGVQPALRDSLFDRGVAGGPGAGSGLGLHVARRVLVEAGGSLDHEARRGGGSSFVMRLRRHRRAEPSPAREPTARPDCGLAAVP